MPLPLQVVYAQLTKSITQPLNISFLTSPLSVSILTCIKVEGRCYLLSKQRLVLVLSSDLTVASLSVGEEVEAMQRREAAGVGGLTRLLRGTQAHVRRVSDALMHLSDAGRTLPSPTSSSARLWDPAEVCSPSPSHRAPRTCLTLPRMSLDCLGSPTRLGSHQDVVSVTALDSLGRPTSTSTV